MNTQENPRRGYKSDLVPETGAFLLTTPDTVGAVRYESPLVARYEFENKYLREFVFSMFKGGVSLVALNFTTEQLSANIDSGNMPAAGIFAAWAAITVGVIGTQARDYLRKRYGIKRSMAEAEAYLPKGENWLTIGKYGTDYRK